jgi:hypothetical protein
MDLGTVMVMAVMKTFCPGILSGNSLDQMDKGRLVKEDKM